MCLIVFFLSSSVLLSVDHFSGETGKKQKTHRVGDSPSLKRFIAPKSLLLTNYMSSRHLTEVLALK